MAIEYFEHITRIGDRWDLIAYEYYGDATLIKPLLKANPALLNDPEMPVALVLDKGIRIRVPVLSEDEVTSNLLPPWKRL